MTWTAKTLTLTAVAVLLSACGGSDGGSGSEAEEAPTEAEDGAGQVLHDWVGCMRGEGIDLPDPVRDDGGNLVISGDGFELRPPAGGETSAEFGEHAMTEVSAAIDVCDDPPMLEPGVASEATIEAHEARQQAFEDCMAEHGFENLPEDTPQGPGSGPDSAEEVAARACQTAS